MVVEKLPGNSHIDKQGSIPVYSFPDFDHKAVQMEDEEEQKDKSIPYRIAIPFAVNINVLDESYQFIDDNGQTNYILELNVEGAKAVGIIFEKFRIPEGAELYVYNEELTSINGAITSINNNHRNRMQVTPVEGDVIFILYKEPAFASYQGELVIETVTHVYRDLYSKTKGYGDSGSCNINVVCEEGDGFEDEVRSIAMIINGDGSRICSGAMINNTALDCTPYLLSAEHCLPSDLSDLGVWSFIFDYKSADCDPSVNGLLGNSVFGSELIASNDTYDFALLELDNQPPANYNIYYAGWSRSTIAFTGSTCLHHPHGDVMKVSNDFDPPTLTNYIGEPLGDNYYWQVSDWDEGTTEGGSSGSPLFNSTGKIIGQLRGGTAACGNNSPDYFGAFYLSWDEGTQSDERLMDWLDPDNLDVNSLAGSNVCALGINEVNREPSFVIYPNPTNEKLTIKIDNLMYINEIRVVDINGKISRSFVVNSTISESHSINVEDLSKGIYQLQLITSDGYYSKEFIIQ